jgi:hypothetical protein
VTTIITPTKADGATSVSTAMTEVPPGQTATPESLAAMAAGTNLNGVFLADLLSAFLAHEQCGVHLYRVVAGATQNPILKNRYNAFLAQTEQHVTILETLISRLGGNPCYVSPSARLVHSLNTHILGGVVLAAGSADILPREMAMLEAVLLAETKDHADWAFLAALVNDLDASPVRDALQDAVDRVEPEEDEHVEWARNTWTRMNTMQVHSTAAMKVADFSEKAFASIKNALSGS